MIFRLLLVCSFLAGTSLAAGSCTDKGTPQYCQDNKQFCDDPFGSDTRFYCKKTCGLCQDSTAAPGNDCKDKGTPAYCEANKDGCDDPFGSDTRFYCRETCGLCKDPNISYTTGARAVTTRKTTVKQICKDGDGAEACQQKKYLCTNAIFPEYKQSCRKTCGLCVDPADPPIPPCQDKILNCEQKKYMCTNAMFPEYKYDCKKTCGLCS